MLSQGDAGGSTSGPAAGLQVRPDTCSGKPPRRWDKSTAWAVLAGAENFSDADILGKDARAVQEELADVWIHEIADLSGLSRTDIEHVKAFASRTNDQGPGGL